MVIARTARAAFTKSSPVRIWLYYFEKCSSNASLKSGAVIAMDIAIPNTIMRIATEAEVMWTKKHFNELISGIKFTSILSDVIIQQLVKKTLQVCCAAKQEP